MKWFIKCLRHYADFSGRARRKEYWMFLLFNIIFAFAWAIFASLIFMPLIKNSFENATQAIYYSYLFAMLLPSLAVLVRRLHDIGKSGWMILIVLIPAVGAIWLLVLMVKEGEQGQNLYGYDPKTSPEFYSSKAKFTSAAIAMIVSSIALILMRSITLVMSIIRELHLNYSFYLAFLAVILLLISGIWLLKEKKIWVTRNFGKNAFTMILVATSIFVIVNIINVFLFGKFWELLFLIIQINRIITYLFIALFAASILFSPHKKNIRISAVLAIIFLGLSILCMVYQQFGISGLGSMYNGEKIFDFFTVVYYISFIVLAGTFLSKDELQPEIDELASEKEYSSLPVEQVVAEPLLQATPEIKKPTLLWVIIGFAITIVLFVTSLDVIDKLWYLFVLFILWDIATLGQYFGRKKAYEKMLKTATNNTVNNVQLATPATIRVVRESSMLGAAVPYKVFLNNQYVGKIKNGKILEIATSVSHNIVMIFDNNDNPFNGEFVADLEDGGYAEVHVKAGKIKFTK